MNGALNSNLFFFGNWEKRNNLQRAKAIRPDRWFAPPVLPSRMEIRPSTAPTVNISSAFRTTDHLEWMLDLCFDQRTPIASACDLWFNLQFHLWFKFFYASLLNNRTLHWKCSKLLGKHKTSNQTNTLFPPQVTTLVNRRCTKGMQTSLLWGPGQPGLHGSTLTVPPNSLRWCSRAQTTA